MSDNIIYIRHNMSNNDIPMELKNLCRQFNTYVDKVYYARCQGTKEGNTVYNLMEYDSKTRKSNELNPSLNKNQLIQELKQLSTNIGNFTLFLDANLTIPNNNESTEEAHYLIREISPQKTIAFSENPECVKHIKKYLIDNNIIGTGCARTEINENYRNLHPTLNSHGKLFTHPTAVAEEKKEGPTFS